MADEKPPENTETKPPESAPPETKPPAPQISQEQYNALQTKLADSEKQNKDFKTQFSKAEEDALKAKEDWKAVAELKTKEALEATEKSEILQKTYINEKKYSALKTECFKLGLKPEAEKILELFDLSDIQVETTSHGRVNLLGTATTAEKIKTLHAYAFGESKAPNVNTDIPGVTEGTIVTPADLAKAEREGKKSGDPSKYRQMYNIYLKQRAAG